MGDLEGSSEKVPESIDSDLSSPSDSTIDDLFADIDSPDDLAALGFADDDDDSASIASASAPAVDQPDLSTESTDSLFSADTDLVTDDSSSDDDSIFGSDSLAVDESDKSSFEPTPDSTLPPNYKSYEYKESSGGFTKYIIIGIVLIAIAASAMLYFTGGDGEDKKKAMKETKKVVPKKKVPVKKAPEKEAPVAVVEPQEKKPVETKKVEKPIAANVGDQGSVTMIDSKTSVSYIIIGSFVDEDLAMDFANKTVTGGSSVKIIRPYGKSKRYRVSIADYPTYGDAASQLDSYKGQYGDQVWALKY